jgi:FG-GAP repeat
MRRLAVVLTVLLAAGVCPVPSVVSASFAAYQAAGEPLAGDFNGDGSADLAVGAPGEDLGAVADAGAVNVLYHGTTPGSPGGWSGVGSQLFTQNEAGGHAEAGDGFGRVVAVGNFNGDGFGDLAIAAPGENVGSMRDAGAVNVLYGSASGLSGVGAQQVTQNSPGVGSSAELDDVFGAALAAGDFNGDALDDLAVGVPSEAGVVRSGAVNILYGSAAGLSGAGSQVFTQNSPGVVDSSEAGDRFGQALAAGDFNGDAFAELAVGAPREDAGSLRDAGAVTVLLGDASGLTGAASVVFTQDTPGVGGSAEAGDLFGLALAAGVTVFGQPRFANLAIGAPGEDVFTVPDAGAVTLLFGGVGGLQGPGSEGFSQNNIGTGPGAEAGDLFGFALAMGDFNGSGSDEEPIGEVDLAIGVPGEDLFSLVDAGVVDVVYNDWPFFGHPNPRHLQLTQAGPGAGPEPGDRYGFALTSTGGSLATVAVGAPGEDVDTAAGRVVGAGAVSVLVGTPDFQGEGGRGLVGLPGLLYQNSPGVGSSAEPGDLFGDALATLGI